jgi:polar amino acid transport system substrate-binding protein
LEQETFLKQVKCDKAQGYLYSKPLPKDEAEKLLRI